MNQLPVEQVHIHFQGSTQRETHELSQTGQVAIEQVVGALEQEGVDVNLLPAVAADGDGARGVVFDDVVINIVANAITTLLFRVVGEVITRIRIARLRRAQHPPNDDVVTLQMGQRRISFSVDIAPGSLYQQLELWTTESPPSPDITIVLGKSAPPQ